MSKSRIPDPPHPPTSAPSAADIESAALASLHNSRKSSLPRSSLSRQKGSRKPVPIITHNHVAFPADDTPQQDEKRPVPEQRRLTTSSPSAVPSSQRIMPSPSLPPPLHLTPRSPLISAGQPAVGPDSSQASAQKSSSSLARNSSVPASLSHSNRSSNVPTRSASVVQSRPSLSSPSPPTPIVPSIPLRHATQHSPAQSSTLTTTPLTSHISYSVPATSSDRHIPSRKHPAEHSPTAASFATASDPNLPSRSATSTPVIPSEPAQYNLPLKQLLSKPANPSNFHSGSESEGGSLTPFSRHHRSTSATESIQFAISRRDSALSAIERAAILSLQSRPLTSPRTGGHERRNHDRYHYRRTTDAAIKEYDVQQKEHTNRVQETFDTGWWPDWKPRDEPKRKSKKDKGKDKTANAQPRNVLRRRPSNSSKPPDSRNPTPSGGPRLSRSLSTSSLFKRAGFLAARTPTVRTISPLPNKSPSPQPLAFNASPSPSPVIFSDATDRDNFLNYSHVDRTAAQQQDDHKMDTNSHTVTSQDLATGSILTSSIPTPSPVSKQHSPNFLNSTPVSNYLHQPMTARLSTISSGSGSSAASKGPQSRDKALSPAGAVADAYKREQFAKETTKSTPTRPPRPPSPNFPPTVGDKENGDLKQVEDSNGNFDYHPGSRRSSRSGLSYAEIPANGGDVIDKRTSHGEGVKGAIEGPQQHSPEIDGVLVTNEVSSRSFLVQSPQSSDSRPFSPRSSLSSPRMSNGDPRSRNRLKKARHTSDQSELGHKPYYTVVGARSDQVYSVGGPRDSFGAGWGVRTTITAGTRVVDGEKEKGSLGRSLSRKISGKFKRDRSAGGSDEKVDAMRGRSRWQNGRAVSAHPQPSSPEDNPDRKDSDDRCLPYLYSLKKHAQSEIDISAKDRSSGVFPKFWRLFGRSKSKERSGEDIKVDDPPPLPTLPKHHASLPQDLYTPVYSRRERGQDNPSPHTRKSPRSSKSSPSTPSARPSTATSDATSPRFWNRHNSAPSSTSSLGDVPPMPSPLPNMTRYANTDDPGAQKPETSGAIHLTQVLHAEPEQMYYKPATDVQRSDSPPIPSFSTVDAINSFPPRRSSDRSKNSPTSPSTPSPTSPPPRPTRSSQRPKTAPSRPNSFGDEALYPPVMKQSTRSIPKMTFREIDSGKRDNKLTEQEKADRWDALLEKSDAAGGTLHFGGNDDKLPSDDLRFSRTLSELAQDDD